MALGAGVAHAGGSFFLETLSRTFVKLRVRDHTTVTYRGYEIAEFLRECLVCLGRDLVVLYEDGVQRLLAIKWILSDMRQQR